MQDGILPDAQKLYEWASGRVDAATTASTRIPAPAILVVATTIVFGLFAARWLARRTRRRINLGLVAGGLAIAVMVGWVGTALIISTAGSRQAKNTSADSLRVITNLSITAQQARADETLSLIRRGDENARKQSYYHRMQTMDELLTSYLSRHDSVDKSDLADTDQLLARWQSADERINAYISVGNYQAATQVALGTGEDDSTPAFDKLEQALSSGLKASRNQLRSDIVSAQRVLSGTTVGGIVLSLGAAIAVALGLWPRMSEYR